MCGKLLAGKVEPVGWTPTNSVYCRPGETTVVKAPGLWLDGKCWDDRRDRGGPPLEDEEEIYKIIGEHPRIVKCLGLVDLAPGVRGLKLERATIGGVRDYIQDHCDDPPPIGKRLRIALEFAEGMAYLHQKDVIWRDASARNALYFDDLHVKLCDFGISLAGWHDLEPEFLNETRAEVPPRGRKESEIPFIVMELFALGSAIFEITEWKPPLDDFDELEAMQMVFDDKLSSISDDNPARDIIDGCWQERYGTAESIVEDLKKLVSHSIV